MVVTYYIIKVFRTETDRHSGLLMYLFLIAAEIMSLM